jgi:phosphatidylinositol kinase/protein kinase (PI-3  family)
MLSQQLFSETDDEFVERLRNQSPYGHLKTWSLCRLIVKSNDDLRSEMFAM